MSRAEPEGLREFVVRLSASWRRRRGGVPTAPLARAASVGPGHRVRFGLLAAGGAAVTVVALVVALVVASRSLVLRTDSMVQVAAGRTELVGVGMVLEQDAGPRLCLGVVRQSYPPQCSGLPIAGWDWSAAPASTSASGVRWGEYTVIGTFDGSTFTLTRPARVRDDSRRPRPPALPDFRTPCPVPPGGWKVIDPAKATQAALDATLAAAESIPGYAGSWLDQSINPVDPAKAPEPMNDPTKLVLNVRVVGDVGAAEQRLRQTWGGALCVTTASLTSARLLEIQRELLARSGEVGLLSSGSSPVANRVDIEVLFDDGRLQRELDTTYGRGAVLVTSTLQPYAG